MRSDWRRGSPLVGMPSMPRPACPPTSSSPSLTRVYGLAGRRNHPSTDIVFQVPRADIEVEVHQRVNVRVLELIRRSTGERIELEGNRVPLTHSKDVIDHLR